MDAEGLVRAVSGNRCDFTSGRNPGAATLKDRGPVPSARSQDPGKGGALPAAEPPAAPPQLEDVDLPDANPALHEWIRRMLDQHKDMLTGFLRRPKVRACRSV